MSQLVGAGGGHGASDFGGRGRAGGGGGGGGNKRLLRVAADMSTLSSLAVHWGSSILVRYDTAAMDVMRAIITGPEGACGV